LLLLELLLMLLLELLLLLLELLLLLLLLSLEGRQLVRLQWGIIGPHDPIAIRSLGFATNQRLVIQ